MLKSTDSNLCHIIDPISFDVRLKLNSDRLKIKILIISILLNGVVGTHELYVCRG